MSSWPFHLPPLVSACSWFGPGHLQWWRQQNSAGFVFARASSPNTAVLPMWAVRGAGLGAEWRGDICQRHPKRGKLEPQTGYGPGTSLKVKHCRQLLLISPQPLCLQSRTHCQRHHAPKASPVQNNQKVLYQPLKSLKTNNLEGRLWLAYIHAYYHLSQLPGCDKITSCKNKIITRLGYLCIESVLSYLLEWYATS